MRQIVLEITIPLTPPLRIPFSPFPIHSTLPNPDLPPISRQLAISLTVTLLRPSEGTRTVVGGHTTHMPC